LMSLMLLMISLKKERGPCCSTRWKERKKGQAGRQEGQWERGSGRCGQWGRRRT
jgi:hypothetical protein